MILALLLAASDPAVVRFDKCAALAKADPAAAVKEAEAWRVAGGGWPARQCLGLGFVAQERFGPAALAFAQAAQEAEIQRDGRAAELWVQSGNASLADGDAAQARVSLDRGLALPVLAGAMRGEAKLDRARADVAAGDMASARADLDEATRLVPADPMAWLLSATLARRQNDAARAAVDIARANALAPNDAAVAFEAGNIAHLAGRADEAKAEWTRAAKLAPNDPAGQAAAQALAGS